MPSQNHRDRRVRAQVVLPAGDRVDVPRSIDSCGVAPGSGGYERIDKEAADGRQTAGDQAGRDIADDATLGKECCGPDLTERDGGDRDHCQEDRPQRVLAGNQANRDPDAGTGPQAGPVALLDQVGAGGADQVDPQVGPVGGRKAGQGLADHLLEREPLGQLDLTAGKFRTDHRCRGDGQHCSHDAPFNAR